MSGPATASGSNTGSVPQDAAFAAQNVNHSLAAEQKRKAEVDPDMARRLKHARPPLPPPHVLRSLVPDSPAFTELMDIEQRLDWTLLRKKADINDALGRVQKIKRHLRVYISNTAHDQPWQLREKKRVGETTNEAGPSKSITTDGEAGKESTVVEAGKATSGGDIAMAEPGVEGEELEKAKNGEINVESEDKADRVADGTVTAGKEKEKENDLKSGGEPPAGANVETGKGVAGWVLRIEGRMLDSGHVRHDKTRRKFSSYIKSIVIEFDKREAPTFPEGNIVEWHNQPTKLPLDGFEILRRGDSNVKCRIILHIAHEVERFKVLPPLAEVIALNEGTRAEIMAAVWQLVKVAGAQDKEDATILRPVGGLEKITPVGADGLAFHQIPELVGRFLSHPDPVVIPYEIKVDQEANLHPKCFDIPVEIADPVKSKMATIIAGFEGQEGKEIVKLEDQVGELAYFARDLKQKRDFLESFAANPQAFIHNWLAAQARDLDQMLGYQIGPHTLNGGSIREEDLRRSDLFHLPWVDEAIMIHEAQRIEAERAERRAGR